MHACSYLMLHASIAGVEMKGYERIAEFKNDKNHKTQVSTFEGVRGNLWRKFFLIFLVRLFHISLNATWNFLISFFFVALLWFLEFQTRNLNCEKINLNRSWDSFSSANVVELHCRGILRDFNLSFQTIFQFSCFLLTENFPIFLFFIDGKSEQRWMKGLLLSSFASL